MPDRALDTASRTRARLAGVIVVYVAVLAAAGLVLRYLVGEVGERAVEGASDAPHLLTEEMLIDATERVETPWM